MTGFGRPWAIAGGWAVDLLLGRVTRPHADIELAVLRDDQSALRRHLRGWDFEKVVPASDGGRREPWQGERLELPVHELHARPALASLPELEVLLNESAGRRWVYRRNSQVSAPLSRFAVLSPPGVPALAPEIVLLYKAKQPQCRDEQDFGSLLPHLTPRQTEWLCFSLALCHPAHPWLALLSGDWTPA